jgi:hypothetical protein
LIFQVFVCAPTPRRASLSSDLDCIIPEASFALPPASAGPPVPRVVPRSHRDPSLRRDTLGLALVKQPHARPRSSSFTCARAARKRGKNVEAAARSRLPEGLSRRRCRRLPPFRSPRATPPPHAEALGFPLLTDLSICPKASPGAPLTATCGDEIWLCLGSLGEAGRAGRAGRAGHHGEIASRSRAAQ